MARNNKSKFKSHYIYLVVVGVIILIYYVQFVYESRDLLDAHNAEPILLDATSKSNVAEFNSSIQSAKLQQYLHKQLKHSIHNKSKHPKQQNQIFATAQLINDTVDFIKNRKQKKQKKKIKKKATPISTKEDYESMIAAIKSFKSWEYIKDNISTRRDIIKYKKTNHTLCDVFYYTKVLIGAHHKTGSVLLEWQLSQQGVRYYLDSICSWNDKPQYFGAYAYQFKMNYHLENKSIVEWLQKHSSMIDYFHNERPDIYPKLAHIVIMNIIRNPVDTILSSYNYHKKGAEQWTTVSLHKLPRLFTKFNEFHENKCTAKVFLNLTKSMGLDTNVSIKTLYTEKLSESEGIYFEFMRYSKCCWYEIYSSYDTMNRLINKEFKWVWYDWDLIHIKQFRLENFLVDFNRSCNEYLDVMGILEHEDRRYLMDKYQRWKYDITNTSKLKTYKKAKHITTGKYDKEAAIKILLKLDINGNWKEMDRAQDRCYLLKNRTMLLGYKWLYHDIC